MASHSPPVWPVGVGAAHRWGGYTLRAEVVRSCRVCGCTDNDCGGCIERTGRPCYWVGPDLCSACVDPAEMDLAA